METVTENAEYCKFHNNKKAFKFNLAHMNYDEHPGNQIAIKKVFGVKFYQERTSSCEYHVNKSVEKHMKFLVMKTLISTYKKTLYRHEKLCGNRKL